MKIDLHCHSKYSHDNNLEPEKLIGRAISLGLDGVCFTEHHSYENSRPISRMKIPDGFLVFRGVEVSTDEGHLLVYGVTDDSWNRWSRNNFLKMEEVMKSVHGLGGICVPAHPFRGWESLGERIFSIPGFDALETHNGGNRLNQNLLAAEASSKLGLPSIGGSDCHYIHQVGRSYTVFQNRVPSLELLVAEIKAGNCHGEHWDYGS
ncbi:CehA/McbA family metallohydrolase [Desulfomonile tiedjei]|uniref:Putative metal-dependent phosphoesterase, PHP family n=1 Tax=Desulfomonile tiedjei (strain ATCC 49306 / DSM 6799 / DCB-1) TaxID=706587 RepID=I4C8B9_DESTA|nr:PHP domain-containing protein [Desulfomonile tiedjei]AFM25810.1 putative metal-dependent phosphoesterase, PHP family [Desulfomonile tiedjei DSM 6799]